MGGKNRTLLGRKDRGLLHAPVPVLVMCLMFYSIPVLFAQAPGVTQSAEAPASSCRNNRFSRSYFSMAEVLAAAAASSRTMSMAGATHCPPVNGMPISVCGCCSHLIYNPRGYRAILGSRRSG